jgi:hypothetical protein
MKGLLYVRLAALPSASRQSTVAVDAGVQTYLMGFSGTGSLAALVM